MKVYELEEKNGELSAAEGPARRKNAKKAAAVIAAVLGVAVEFILGLPVYIVLAAVAVVSLPAALISRAKKRAQRAAE